MLKQNRSWYNGKFNKFIANGNLYATLNKGTFGDTAPTHTEGIELNGDINVLFLSKVCKYETINKN